MLSRALVRIAPSYQGVRPKWVFRYIKRSRPYHFLLILRKRAIHTFHVHTSIMRTEFVLVITRLVSIESAAILARTRDDSGETTRHWLRRYSSWRQLHLTWKCRALGRHTRSIIVYHVSLFLTNSNSFFNVPAYPLRSAYRLAHISSPWRRYSSLGSISSFVDSM